jgi:4a-hydroxytetrahydrobiopterin dehydratase
MPLAQTVKAMTATEVVASLAKLEGWRLCGDGPDIAIEKTYDFANYAQTMAFVNAVAWLAQARNHHPDMLVQFSHCRVQWRTHDVAGLSRLDFDSAAAVDALTSSVTAKNS